MLPMGLVEDPEEGLTTGGPGCRAFPRRPDGLEARAAAWASTLTAPQGFRR